MMAMRSLLLDQRGFSLAELLMVVAILGLMLAGLVFVQQQGQQSYLMGAHRVEAQQNARVALDLMVRELRSAQTITAVPSGGLLGQLLCDLDNLLNSSAVVRAIDNNLTVVARGIATLV